MKPNDIAGITHVSDPQLSPDGKHLVYVVTRGNDEANTYRSQIWVAATDGSSAARPLSSGEHSDANPRWSPDGCRIAFTSSRTKDAKGKTKSTLHLLPFGVPGETVTLASADEAFGELSFSPDGAWLAMSHRTRGEHYDSDEIGRRPPRKIDHLFFSLNGAGFTIDRPSHIYVIATDGSTGLRNLTPGSDEFSSPVWFPDSTRLAMIVDQHRIDYASNVAILEVGATDPETTEMTLLTNSTGLYSRLAISADGETIYVSGFEDPGTLIQNAHIGTLAVGSVGTPDWMTTAIDRTWAPYMCATGPTVTADGSLLGAIADRGNVHIYRVTPGAEPEQVIAGDLTVTGFSEVSVDGASVFAYTATTRDQPSELFVVVDGQTAQVTSASSAFTARTNPRPGEHFLVPSDGHEVDAWIFRPHNFDPAKTYPTLLNIHGGPFTQYGNFYMDEFQMQAEAGYVVLCSNPRGGSGRDNDWGMSILGPKHKNPGTGWGAADYDDCMAVVDTALERFDFIDPDRLGVLGGSYGGYMTSWIVTHTDRFAAACSERAVNNLESLEYHSDVAGIFSAYIGPSFLNDPEEYRRASPITYVDNLNTPLLIVHSEEDLRCPQDQATQLFVACQLLGKPDVEYYLFPGESHELSRSGTPIHRRQRAELIIDFFNRYLGQSTED